MINLEQTAEELRQRRPDLSTHNIKIKVDYTTDNLLVANDEIGFCILREAILDNIHLAIFDAGIEDLIKFADYPALVKQVKDQR